MPIITGALFIYRADLSSAHTDRWAPWRPLPAPDLWTPTTTTPPRRAHQHWLAAQPVVGDVTGIWADV